MNKNISDDIKNINSYLRKNNLVLEYEKLKSAISNSQELNLILGEMKLLKKCSMTEEERTRYSVLKKKYDLNPLVQNFKQAEKELKELEEEIKNNLDL